MKNLIGKVIKILFVTVYCLVPMTCAYANDQFHIGYSTRVIVHSDEKKVSFPVKNGSKQKMVFHAQVLKKNKFEFSNDFIVSPELTRFEPGEEKWLQIINLGQKVPVDRESLFYLKGHFLPASTINSDDKASVNFSYAIQMKLFYRPAKFRAEIDAIDDNLDKLKFKLEDGYLVANNESPFFMTFNRLISDGEEINIPSESVTIEPFGIVKIGIANKNIKNITWTLINDGGYSTKPITTKL